MEMSWSEQWQLTRQQLTQIHLIILKFLRHPIDQITTIPNWNWLTLALVQTSIAAASGVLSGLVSRSFINILFGLFIFPITAVIAVLVVASFLYYTILFFQKKEVSYRKIVTIVIFANIYFLIVRTLSPLIPAIDLIGAGVSAAIMIVGMSDNFGLDRKFVIRVVSTLYAIVLISWITRMIRESEVFSKPKAPVTSESWEILEREVNSIESEE